MAFALYDKAKEELEEYQRGLIRQLGLHLITLEQANRLLWAKVREIVANGMQEVDDVRNVPILCNGCGRVNVIASDVLRYHCVCSPNEDRYTFKSRKLDLQTGKTAVEDLMTANTGRQSIIG